MTVMRSSRWSGVVSVPRDVGASHWPTDVLVRVLRVDHLLRGFLEAILDNLLGVIQVITHGGSPGIQPDFGLPKGMGTSVNVPAFYSR